MQISLSPELAQFVQEKVDTGVYASPDDVIADGLRVLRDLPEWTDDALRKEINVGLEQLDRGEGAPWNPEEVKAEVLRRHATRRSAP